MVIALMVENVALAAALLGSITPLEVVLLDQVPQTKAPPSRNLRATGSFDLDAYSDDESVEKFRFTRSDIRRLVDCLKVPGVFQTPERSRCSAIEALCILLRRLSVPDRWSDLESMFSRSRSGLSNIFLFMVDHLVLSFGDLLYMDRNRLADSLDRFCNAVKAQGGEVDNVWGFIDGTRRKVCRPKSGAAQRSVYSGHKRYHGSKYQTISTPDGMIAHLHGPIEGRLHDHTLLKHSKVEEVLDADPRFDNYVVYGDPAYGRTNQFACPLKSAKLTRAQRAVNKSMSRVCVSVEWSYGQVVRHWPFLDHKKKNMIGVSPVGSIYKVAVLLTNCLKCCRRGNTNSRFFKLEPPSLEEYLQYHQP